MARKTYRRSGFTLLEVLLVIGIIVALAALVVPNIVGRGKKAEVDRTIIQIKSIEDALEMFRLDMGRYPSTDEGLAVLTNGEDIEDDEEQEKWTGPYLKAKGDVTDAWGNEFRYTCPGENNEDSFDLCSDGPDKEEGTEDDVVNWEEEDE